MSISLSSLRAIIQAVNAKQSHTERAQHIVASMCSALNVPVCSMYVMTDDQHLLLTATQGLSPDAVGVLSLPLGVGLVGFVAEQGKALNVSEADKHPSFHPISEIGEEMYRGFLAVPIIHLGHTVGVLVVQTDQARLFSDEEEAFTITVASQLAVDFDAANFITYKSRRELRLHGKAASPGIGIGIAVSACAAEIFSNVKNLEISDVGAEMSRFHAALEDAKKDIEQVFTRISEGGPGAGLADAYGSMLSDPGFISGVEARIQNSSSAPYAIKQTAEEIAKVFEAMDDSYLRARAEDVYHVAGKVIEFCDPSLSRVEIHNGPIVLFGDTIAASDIAAYAEQQLVGVISRKGSSLSHAAIVANAMGIPCVVGVENLSALNPEDETIVDGYSGRVFIKPSDIMLQEFRTVMEKEQRDYKDLDAIKDQPGVTLDGQNVELLVNTGLLSEISPGLARGAEGVGLYRSEIPFLVSESFPTESEQEALYSQVIHSFGGRPVTMRTLDIGGDKPLPYFSFNEENPFLGWRGLRFCLDNRPVLRAQLRAMLRAAGDSTTLRIMVPMVNDVKQVDQVRQILDDCINELENDGLRIHHPPFGIMLEVPSLISQIKHLRGKVDFISIGSNDLTQYLLAVDRNNERVASLFNHVHPAVIHEVNRIVESCRKHSIKVGVCGEMAAHPLAVILLIGMQVDSLSMSAFQLPKIKKLIRSISASSAHKLLQSALQLSSAEAIESMLIDALDRAGVKYLFNVGGSQN